MGFVVLPSPEKMSRRCRPETKSLLVAMMLAALLLLVLYSSGADTEEQMPSGFQGGHRRELVAPFSGNFSSRKLLQEGGGLGGSSAASTSSGSTERMGEACSKDDIVVHQGATTPLPSGIPTYTVEVLNLCADNEGCSLAHIHLSCGWFSSARLVNPRIFRRLRYNDCLLNDDRPLPPGSSISFQYANSFRYPLAVSSASCVS